jgi:hypothetical protein
VRRIKGISCEFASAALTFLADVCTFTAKIHDSAYDETAIFIFGKQASSSSISPQEQVNVGMLGNKTFDSLQKK